MRRQRRRDGPMPVLPLTPEPVVYQLGMELVLRLALLLLAGLPVVPVTRAFLVFDPQTLRTAYTRFSVGSAAWALT